MKRVLLGVIVLGVGWMIVMPFLGFHNDGPADGQEKRPRTEFAQARLPQDGVKPLPFNGERAMGYLKAVCALGPRMSGAAGMKKQQQLIRKHFEDLGYKVQEQKFEARQESRDDPVEM